MGTEHKEPGQTLTLPDGRKLGYLVVGEGKPVFFFQGFPGSRLTVLSLEAMAKSKALQIIGVDRPGFGLSTYAPQRRIRDFAADVSFLADRLGIEKFALVGVSTGGHYATTCTALHSKRVTRTVVVSGLTLPPDTSGMFSTVKGLYRFGTLPIVGEWIQKRIRNIWFEADKDPGAFFDSRAGKNSLEPLPEADQKFMISIAKGPTGFFSDCRDISSGTRQYPSSNPTTQAPEDGMGCGSVADTIRSSSPLARYC